MKSVAIFGASTPVLNGLGPALNQTVTVDGVTVRCGVVEAAAPRFDRRAPENRQRVLLRTAAFSCNYRDKGIVYLMRAVPSHRFTSLGSEFVAEVIDAGEQVQSLAPGDWVVPDHHYVSGVAPGGVREGVATNQASRGLHVHHESKLVKIAPDMPHDAAAALSLGAQTAYSIARRLPAAPGDRILVTSATSNTSLFAIQVLRQHAVQLSAATTDAEARERLMALGADRVIVIDRHAAAEDRARVLAKAAADAGGFDAVVDPFFDLHLDSALDVLNPFGTYVTCGLLGQTPHLARSAHLASLDAGAMMQRAIVKNLTIVGNCLGLRQDLERALADYAARRLQVVIDSVFDGADVKPFLERSFNDRRRFGKVVFRYAS